MNTLSVGLDEIASGVKVGNGNIRDSCGGWKLDLSSPLVVIALANDLTCRPISFKINSLNWADAMGIVMHILVHRSFVGEV